MTANTQIRNVATGNRWRVITQALIGGFVVWNAMLWFSIEIDGYPTGAAAPTAWVVAVGVVSYLLLRRDLLSGYVLSVLTGILGLVSLALLVVGPHGPPPGEPASPALFAIFGPGAHVAVAMVLIGSASLAWRDRVERRESSSPDQTEVPP